MNLCAVDLVAKAARSKNYEVNMQNWWVGWGELASLFDHVLRDVNDLYSLLVSKAKKTK